MINLDYVKHCLNSKISIYQAGVGFVFTYVILELVKSSLVNKKAKTITPHRVSDQPQESANQKLEEIQPDKTDLTNKSPAVTSSATPTTIEASKPLSTEEKDEDESDSEEEDDSMYYENNSGVEIRDNYTRLDGPFKLMLCVNTSLNMGKGKIGAQCGHATLGAYKISSKRCQSALKNWSTFGQAKICVKTDNDEIMHDIASIAQSAGLVTYIVEDAGRTQIAAGSQTVLAIGPAPEAILKTITGQLKLL